MQSNDNEREKNDLLKLLASYSILALIILSVSVNTLMKRANNASAAPHEIITEYVYIDNDNIPLQTDTELTDTESNTVNAEKEIFIIREYMEKIGVFSQKGELLIMLEVYTKTLPEADKILLGEGFEVVGKNQLNAIIEDYTG